MPDAAPEPNGPDPRQKHLDDLRRWRNPVDKDLSLGFLQEQFQKQIAKPHKQLGKLSELWPQLAPPELAGQARLESLHHGVLHISVTSSSVLYELDRALRSGLQEKLRNACPGKAIRKVHLKLVAGE